MTRAGGAVATSRLKGFYKLDVSKRVEEIARLAGLDEGDRRALLEMEGFGLREADHMIENVIGILPLPIGVEQNPITRSTPARLYQERSNITISPLVGRCCT